MDSDDRTGEGKQEGGLDRKHLAEAEDRSVVSVQVVHRAILIQGDEELARPSSALAWSGLAAGLSMSFSVIAQGALQAHLPDAPWRPVITNLGYSVGFLIVILGRQELFSENTLTPVLPVLERRSGRVLLQMLRVWAVVLATNLLGAFIAAWVIAHTDSFAPPNTAAMVSLGREALDHPFSVILLRGIYAGWLIALIVWMLPSTEAGRFWIIVFITYIVGLAELSHSVAGVVEAMVVASVGQASWSSVLGKYVPAAVIGNTIGGVSLVAALNHAQVAAGRATRPRS